LLIENHLFEKHNFRLTLLIYMYLRNDASKMEIQYNSRLEIEMSVTSNFRLRTSDQFEVEYWVTGKEAVNQINLYFQAI
jgi:hypothetical protein